MNEVAAVRRVTSRGRRTSLRSSVVVLCTIALVAGPGCTTTRTIDGEDEMPAGQELKVGAPVKLSLRDGRVRTLEFVAWTPAEFVGEDANGETLTIRREEIDSLEVRTASAGKTLLLIGGVGALAAFLVVRDLVDALDEAR